MLSRLALGSVVTRWPALTRTTSNQVQAIESAAATVTLQRKTRPIYPAPCRHGFIPEPWFQILYNKTGVSGPYMLFLGLTTFLVSKEFYVLEHEYYTGIAVLCTSILIVKKFGPGFAKYADEKMDEEERQVEMTRIEEKEQFQESIEHEKKQQWRAEAQQMIMDAKKENIKIQLEAAYRERMFNVYNEVKNRLDYQLQIAGVHRRIAQKHMSQWIINNVIKSITPDQEKAALQQCIADLQALAPK